VISQALELPGDRDSDEITLQVVECMRCKFRGLAVFEESHRGSMFDDAWRHTGYQVRDAEVAQVNDLLQACPHPYDSHCTCPAHTTFSKSDRIGNWIGLEGLTVKGTFRMVLTE
jgi:hypothetical protein